MIPLPQCRDETFVWSRVIDSSLTLLMEVV